MKTVIVVGSRDDPQIKITSQFADKVFFWEEWGKVWNTGIIDGKLTFAQFEDSPNKTLNCCKIEAEQSHLYIRYGGCPPEAHETYLGIISFHPNMVGVARPGDAPTNKLTQLRLFGSKAPKTIVTNQMCSLSGEKIAKDLGQELGNLIVKNISIIRSEATSLSHILSTRDLNGKLALPTLIQERVYGEEFKYHFYQTLGGLFELNAKILKFRQTSDYRYQTEGFLCQNESNIPSEVRRTGESLVRLTDVPFIDIDYFIQENGNVKILEWNDSPESVSFEGRMVLKQNWIFSRILLAPSQLITIGPQNDRVVEVIAENYFEKFPKGKRLVELRCEFFPKKWSYSLIDGSLLFNVDGRLVVPEGIYIRPVDIPEGHFHVYDGLFRAIEMWKGQSFGSMKYGYFNMSKMYQTTESLKKSHRNSGSHPKIGFPKSYFIKTSSSDVSALDVIKRSKLPLIVKSCSGQRSIVVDGCTFNNWDQNNLKNIPTLFQEVVTGPDIRVHSLKSKTVSDMFGIKVATKDSIDYRYAAGRGEFEVFNVPDELREFIANIHELEGNPLLGVDFVYSNSKYYCLEANPTPGWNWYYNKNTCRTNFLALGILKTMGITESFSHLKDKCKQTSFSGQEKDLSLFGETQGRGDLDYEAKI
jgi:hypothetical protein